MAGLSFLAKKSWHTSNLSNQEKVWLAEQKAIAEEAKVKELQNQIKLEREKEEFQKLAGKKVVGDRGVDWMYEGGAAAGVGEGQEDSAVEEAKNEAYLLGREYVPEGMEKKSGDFAMAAAMGGVLEKASTYGASIGVAGGSNTAESTTTLRLQDTSSNITTSAAAQGETQGSEWNQNFHLRHEDPMFAVQQKRLAQVNQLEKKRNLMERAGMIVKEVVRRKGEGVDTNIEDSERNDTRESKKRDRKDSKRDRKERKKKKRHHRRERSRSPSDSSRSSSESSRRRHRKKGERRHHRHHESGSSRRRHRGRDHSEERGGGRREHPHSHRRRDNSDSEERGNGRRREEYSHRQLHGRHSHRDDDRREEHRHSSRGQGRYECSYHDGSRSPGRDLNARQSRSPDGERKKSNEQYAPTPNPHKKEGYGLIGTSLTGKTNNEVKIINDGNKKAVSLGPDQKLLTAKREEAERERQARFDMGRRNGDGGRSKQDRERALEEMKRNARDREDKYTQRSEKEDVEGEDYLPKDDGKEFVSNLSAKAFGVRGRERESRGTR